MSNIDVLYLIIFFFCLALSAFFSSSEVAFVSLQRLRIRHLANKEGGAARQVVAMAEKPEQLLTTILLGNNLVNTAAAALATVVVAFAPVFTRSVTPVATSLARVSALSCSDLGVFRISSLMTARAPSARGCATLFAVVRMAWARFASRTALSPKLKSWPPMPTDASPRSW